MTSRRNTVPEWTNIPTPATTRRCTTFSTKAGCGNCALITASPVRACCSMHPAPTAIGSGRTVAGDAGTLPRSGRAVSPCPTDSAVEWLPAVTAPGTTGGGSRLGHAGAGGLFARCAVLNRQRPCLAHDVATDTTFPRRAVARSSGPGQVRCGAATRDSLPGPTRPRQLSGDASFRAAEQFRALLFAGAIWAEERRRRGEADGEEEFLSSHIPEYRGHWGAAVRPSRYWRISETRTSRRSNRKWRSTSRRGTPSGYARQARTTCIRMARGRGTVKTPDDAAGRGT